jgi:hypothetical protein
MMYHHQMLAGVAHEHIDELVEQASRHRLATALRRGRRQLWPEQQPKVATRNSVRGAGSLVSCEVSPRVAEPVR